MKMLDNLQVTATTTTTTMSPTAATMNMATMPMEILADAKVEEKTKTSTTTTTTTKNIEEKPYSNSKSHNKTKTILNWLKNTSNTTAVTPKTIVTKTTTTTTTTAHKNNKEIDACQQQQQYFEPRNQLDKQTTKESYNTKTTQQLATSVNCACFLLTVVNVNDACSCLKLQQQQQQNITHHHHIKPSNTQKNIKIPSLSPKRFCSPADETLREFRGVQTLKHFWNKRITTNKESDLRLKASKNPPLFTKSQSCLLGTCNQTGEPPPGELFFENSTPAPFLNHKLRAQSLHDCSQDFEELSVLNDIEIQKHLEKDNFYKYKTAEQALKLRELSEHSAARRFSAGIILPLVQGFQKSERWFAKRKTTTPLSSPCNTYKQTAEKTDSDMASLSDIVINDTIPHSKADAINMPGALCQTNVASESAESSPATTTANIPRNRLPGKASPKRKLSKREDATKVSNETTATVSRNSSSNSLAHSSSGGGNSNSRSAPVKRNSTSRKYSFKTHSRSYHATRRMHSQKDITSPVTPMHHPPNSLVAKLTQQFNEIIQHDKSLLAEVKRKNGVLMTHKGHVYKVVETNNKSTTTPSSLSRTSSKSHNLADNAEMSKDTKDILDNSTSAVQKTIMKFESATRNYNKPKVPSKSLKVLKKSNELVINKAGKVIYPPKAVKMQTTKDVETKNTPQTLMIPKTLEIVKEEAKTPVENKTEILKKEENSSPLSKVDDVLKELQMKSKKISTEINKNESMPESAITEMENQRNLNEFKQVQGDIAHNSSNNLERIYGNDNAPIESFITERNAPDQSFGAMHDKELSLAQQQRDSFFEDILKDPRKNEDDLMDYKTIARKCQISRCSSIIVDDPEKNLLLYINDSREKRSSSQASSQIYNSSTGSTQSDESSTKSLSRSSKDKIYQRPSLKLEMPPEFTRELNEKLYSYPKFTFKESEENSLNKEHQIEECKEVDESFNEGNGKLKNVIYGPKDNRLEMAKLTKELKEKTNKEKIMNKNDKPSIEEGERYQEIKAPSESSESKKSKNKHTKFYDKIKFFTMSRKTLKSTQSMETSKFDDGLQPTESQPSLTADPQLYTNMRSPPAQRKETPSVHYSPMYDPESKLLDALQKVDEKLQNLGHPAQEQEIPLVEEQANEYGHHIKPNSSFLHQSYAKDISNKPPILIQAVNVTLVNAIEGEQMIMEQKEIQQTERENEIPIQEHNTAKEIENSNSLVHEEEPLYEPIGFIHIKQEMFNLKTETPLENACLKSSDSTEDGIYQSLEDVLIEQDYDTTKVQSKEDISSIPPSPPERLLSTYEIIQEESNTNILKLNCHLTAPNNYDGYEEYTPSPLDSSSLSAGGINSSITSASSPGIRKTTDVLPDLPKPKRILPKSPMPRRAAPNKLATNSLENSPPLNHTHTEESHYYEEEENIYDTIKGSDCYESLRSVVGGGNKLQKSASECTKNSDGVSISSNCYESISHFKPFRGFTNHHSGGSSHGSTLTLSSENKTNSLYEDSLGSIPHSYSSKRIYRSNTESQIDMQQQQQRIKEDKGSATYNTSMGRASDTSDEWTDVTDNEHGEDDSEGQKPQFIIVRSKAHKSPDWSRRVRDKRLHHQRRSKSYIEDDDPDHYYEQLSPSALNKRHSLGNAQQRTASLQRNQEAVRVSKRGKQISYSAHALGQEISDDSFDSDTDDYYESEQLKNSHNDSGVDIRTSKLPNPPPPSNQMCAFVKKFKNFIGGSKKSPNSSKHGGSQQKIDDGSSQFYVQGNIYTTGTGAATATASGTGTGTGTGPATASFSTAAKTSLQVPQTKELSTSEKNLIMAQSNVTKAEQLSTSTTPRKSKSGKSLRSRLRKSLVGFDSKQLQTLTPTRSTFYVEEPPCNPDDLNNQLDSGFSEKASSGDIPNGASTNTLNSSTAADTHKFTTLARKAKKESKLSNAHRRKTTIGMRPIEPPPPPPDNNGGVRRQSNTSWYAECGVFKNGTTNLVTDDSQLVQGQNNSANMTSGASWYEEAGLYQTSGVSVASSSGSSGVSTSNEGSPADDLVSVFSNEPLYQIYSAAKLEAISRDMHEEGCTDGYEEVGDRRRNIIGEGERQRKLARQTALELVEKERGPARTLWSQIPEVVNSMILPTMTPRERALMEAKFEVITSEASYLKSLNLLRNHFMNHPVFRDQNLVNTRDRKSLFAHIVPVHDCSERLLTELESCWQDNVMLIGLSKRIYAIAEKHFHVYITFCEHQGRMDRTLKRLRSNKGLFSQNLELLESNETCCGLNLHSFLMLPMQRITRLPLLIDAVFSKCDPNDDEYDNWKMCLAIINKIVTQCNEAATKSDQAFEIEKISRQLEFNPSIIRPLAIEPAGVLAPGTKPRFLVKRGEFTHLIWRGDDAKLTFGKKFTKSSIYAFLFSDLMVLTKRKGEQQFSVFDYCPRNMLTITSGDTLPQLPTKDLNNQTSKNLILMTLLENHERKTNELLLSCPSVSEQERWLQAMRPPESETPGEKLYEQWDCPQVMANHAYENNEPDGLSLEVGDVVNVTRKLPDGWYQGERIRDGAVGWFPGSYTEEVNSAHVRARNLKLRHRLLTFTATYLESQKRNK